MANTFTVPPPLPDPLGLAALEPIYARELRRLGLLGNLLMAQGGAGPMIPQSWSSYSDDADVLTLRCEWRIPYISDAHTQLRCMIYGQHPAASGEKGQVQFRSVTAGDTCTLDLAPSASPGYYESVSAAGADQHLTIDASAGYETIQMWSRGDNTGAYATDVWEVDCELVALTSPLAASLIRGPAGLRGSTTMRPIDAADLNDDSALASLHGLSLIETIDALEARPRIYFQWSAADGIKGGGGSYTSQQRRDYRLFLPRPLGSRIGAGYELEWHARIGNASEAVDVDVYASEEKRRPYGTTISAAAGAPAWQSGTMSMAEYRALRETSMPFGQLGFTGAGGDAEIYSLSIWGR